MHVRWNNGAAATPHGQLVFLAEFPAASGVFERWASARPLAYSSRNSPTNQVRTIAKASRSPDELSPR